MKDDSVPTGGGLSLCDVPIHNQVPPGIASLVGFLRRAKYPHHDLLARECDNLDRAPSNGLVHIVSQRRANQR